MKEYNKEFGIQVIEDKYHPEDMRWILLKDNVGKTCISHIITFGDGAQASWKKRLKTKSSLKNMFLVSREMYGEDEYNWKSVSAIRPNLDVFRNFNVQEYKALGEILKIYGLTYNKKKKILIEK